MPESIGNCNGAKLFAAPVCNRPGKPSECCRQQIFSFEPGQAYADKHGEIEPECGHPGRTDEQIHLFQWGVNFIENKDRFQDETCDAANENEPDFFLVALGQQENLQRHGYGDKDGAQPVVIMRRAHYTGKPTHLKEDEINWGGRFFYSHQQLVVMSAEMAISACGGTAGGRRPSAHHRCTIPGSRLHSKQNNIPTSG